MRSSLGKIRVVQRERISQFTPQMPVTSRESYLILVLEENFSSQASCVLILVLFSRDDVSNPF